MLILIISKYLFILYVLMIYLKLKLNLMWKEYINNINYK